MIARDPNVGPRVTTPKLARRFGPAAVYPSSPQSESNGRHPVYKAGALPTELCGQNGSGERIRTPITGFKAQRPAVERHPNNGWGDESRTHNIQIQNLAFRQLNYSPRTCAHHQNRTGATCLRNRHHPIRSDGLGGSGRDRTRSSTLKRRASCLQNYRPMRNKVGFLPTAPLGT